MIKFIMVLMISALLFMSNARSDDATDFLISRLATSHEGEAVNVTSSLLDRARSNRSSFIGKEKLFEKNLQSANPNLAAVSATLMGEIKTDDALLLIINAWRTRGVNNLQQPASYSVWAAAPLYYWFLSGVTEFQSEKSVKFLIGVALDKANTSSMRAMSLRQLSYSNYKDKKNFYDKRLLEVAKEIASSVGNKASEDALAFIGQY